MSTLDVIGNVLWHLFIFATGFITGITLEHILDKAWRKMKDKDERNLRYICGRRVYNLNKRK